MGETLAQKIIRAHLLHGDMTPGSEIALRIDQTLTQDATGTMAYLEFETMGIPRVQTELSVAYVDHNTLQSGFENADDHRYLQTVAKKHGVWFSRPGNGICHQVHLERFGKPGKTLIGSDSHTPTGGGIGMLAFGAGGMDVAVAMGGGAYYITMPKMFKVNLTGTLRPYVTAKDISLELLRILSVKGGVGAIIEWGGPGIAALSVPERATITNMGTELGATTSIFPSDDVTRAFLAAEGREADFIPLASDPDAQYDRVIDIDLNTLQPMIACPHSPDNVVPVETLAGTKVDQVCIGSCTNSSLFDMLKVAALLKGRTIAPGVSLSISPGSKQVLTMLADCGALAMISVSGARILECACGPCIGMGFSPNSGGVSLRTFNRNFEGRSGTADGQIYLETEMFHAGFRPAINAGLSVSRVGGSAQIKAMKKIAAPIRVELAQYRELAAFAQFGSELDADTTEKLAQGARIREMLKQPQYQPMPVAKQIVIIYAAVKKYLMDIPVEEILHFQDALLELIDTRYPEITGKITETQVIDEETEQKLIAAIQETKKEYLA